MVKREGRYLSFGGVHSGRRSDIHSLNSEDWTQRTGIEGQVLVDTEKRNWRGLLDRVICGKRRLTGG